MSAPYTDEKNFDDMVLFEIQGLGENMNSFINHNAEGFLGLASNSKGIDFMQNL